MDSLLGLIPGLLEPRRALPTREIAPCQLNETLDFGRANTVGAFLDGGWSEPEERFRWAVDRKARLRFRFESGQQPAKMSLTLFPLLIPGRVERQRVQVELPDGSHAAVLELTKGEPQEFTVQFPPVDSSSGIFTLTFAFPDAIVPQELGVSGDMRRLSVAFVQMAFS